MIDVGQKRVVGTNVERKIRYTFIMKIDNRRSVTVTKAFAKFLNILPYYFRISITYDNGMEMANHKCLISKTGMDVYIAHLYY